MKILLTAPMDMKEIDMDRLSAMNRNGWEMEFVGTPGKKETPKEFCKRLGICHKTLSKALNDPNRPVVVFERIGENGKLSSISPNPSFERFVLRNKK